MLSWLDHKLDSQWLVTWTLVTFVATLIFIYVLAGVGSPLKKKTDLGIVDLQLAGAYPVLSRWASCLAFGAVAAILDECENVFMWSMLSGNDNSGWLVPALASFFTVPKFLLLLLALVAFLLTLRHAEA